MTRHLLLYAAGTEEAETQSRLRLLRLQALGFLLFWGFFILPTSHWVGGGIADVTIAPKRQADVAQQKWRVPSRDNKPALHGAEPQPPSHVHTSGVTSALK